MATITRIAALPQELAPDGADFLAIDGVGGTRKLALDDAADAIRPIADQATAEAAVDNEDGMSPLRTAQQIDARLADQATAEAGTDDHDLMTAEAAAQATQANVFPTRAALLARNLPAVQISVTTSGYASAGDGGGAEYAWSPTEPTHPGKFQTPDGRWWAIVPFQTLALEAFGAVPNDPLADNTTAINNALQVSRKAQARIVAGPWVYHHAGTLIIPQAAILHGTIGRTEFFLSDGANVTQCETEDFDYYLSEDAYNIEDYPDLTIGFDLDGVIFNGNLDGQTAPVSARWGVRLFGHFYNWTNISIVNTSGTGFWTEEGTPTGAFDYTKARSPDKIDNLQITNSLYENWVHDGPTHVGIGRVVTNISGFESGGTPGTSLMFPTEPIHGVRVRAGFHADSCNFNTALAGRTFMAENARVVIDKMITAGGWGEVLIETTATGSISYLRTQVNSLTYGGVSNPSIENKSANFLFGKVVPVRNSTNVTTAPQIRDSGGTRWDDVSSLQSITSVGTLFEADAQGVSIGRLRAVGVTTALHTTANCNDIDVDCYFNNVTTVWLNEKSGLVGKFSFRGTLNSGQAFDSGVTSGTPIDALSLSKADISFLDNGIRKRNFFRGESAIDLTTTGAKTATFTHSMWRAPTVQEIDVGLRQSGFTTAAVLGDTYVTSFSSTQINARIDVATAATGSAVGQIICRVNC